MAKEVKVLVACGSGVATSTIAQEEIKDIAKNAVSVVSANALSPHTGRFDPKDRDEIIENVEIIKLA